MRHPWKILVLAGLFGVGVAQASDSVRVGNRLLVVGDTAAHVQALLGRPSYRSHRGGSRRRRRGAAWRDMSGGERWQYRRDGRVIEITIVDGRVADVDDRPS